MANLQTNSRASIELAMTARGIARLDFDELATFRKTPPTRFASRVGPSLLKHSDEQAVAALVALDRAMTSANMVNETCDRWGIISTSSYVGRNISAAVFDRFQAEGPWGVSVHPTPHRTLHSIASTAGLGLQSHGPSIGTGGAPGQEPSGVMAAINMLQSQQCDGVWILFSAWSPELAIDGKGQPVSPSTCLATAVAVVAQPVVTSVGRMRLEIIEEQTDAPASLPQPATSLTEFLADEGRKNGSWNCHPCPWMRLEIELTAADLRGPHFAMRGAEQSGKLHEKSQPGQ